MSREAHVRNCESLGVRFPWATRLLPYLRISLIVTGYLKTAELLVMFKKRMCMRPFKLRWETFTYNYSWSDYVGYIDGWIPKLALSVPILGYLILFNDSVSEILSFKYLAKEGVGDFGLEGATRLRLLYFGLICLGIRISLIESRSHIFLNLVLILLNTQRTAYIYLH